MMDAKRDCNCGARPGALHQTGCDVEPCPFCGRQLIGCSCIYVELGERFGWTYKPEIVTACGAEVPEGYVLDCMLDAGRCVYSYPFNGLPEEIYEGGPTDEMAGLWGEMLQEEGLVRWSGHWPGSEECEEWGWFSYRNPDGPGYLPCAEGHPGASHNLNRLAEDAVWSRKRKRFVKRDSDEGREILAAREEAKSGT